MSDSDLLTLPAYSWWRVELLRVTVPYLFALAAALLLTYAVAQVMAKRVFRARPRTSGEAGTAAMEFALAFPIFLTIVLTTIQLALLVRGALVVDYAAFCAARSASVWIGEDWGPQERRNLLPDDRGEGRCSTGSCKWERIQNAAVLACTPISPRLPAFLLGQIGVAGSPSAGAVEEVLRGPFIPDVDRYKDIPKLALAFLEKHAYAKRHTTVEVQFLPLTSTPELGKVHVVVTHEFDMDVPFAGAALGRVFGERFTSFIGDYYIPISSSYSMMTWGDSEQ